MRSSVSSNSSSDFPARRLAPNSLENQALACAVRVTLVSFAALVALEGHRRVAQWSSITLTWWWSVVRSHSRLPVDEEGARGHTNAPERPFLRAQPKML